MSFKPTEDTTLAFTYSNEHQCMVEQYYEQNSFGRWNRKLDAGDGLWRTSLCYLAYQDPILKKSMLDCYQQKQDGSLLIKRYPTEKNSSTTSRDQLLMSVAALYINRDDEELLDILSKVKYRISDRYTMTPSLYLWMKLLKNYLSNKREKYSLALYLSFMIMFYAEMLVAFWSTRALFSIFRIKKYEYRSVFVGNRELKWYHRATHPFFAFHLSTWQLFATPDGPLKNSLKKRFTSYLNFRDKDNILLNKLLRTGRVFDESAYEPSNDFRWQRAFDDTMDAYLYKLDDNRKAFNTFDKDILAKF